MSLGADQLKELAAAVANDRDSWERFVEHDDVERTFHRLSVDDDTEVWLICWGEGHDTGFHDHDGSAGAVSVVEGTVIEERLVVAGPPTRERAERVASAGDSFFFTAFDIHRVRHVGDVPAITIHAYSPPLKRVGSYVVEADGRLARHAQDAEEELKPLAV
jgi:predicted metal-dependent enzyme (double-stranded beta helix superfamily)